jgi:hypothetical protein
MWDERLAQNASVALSQRGAPWWLFPAGLLVAILPRKRWTPASCAARLESRRRFFAKASARTRRTRRITGLKISTRENAARAVAHLGATY